MHSCHLRNVKLETEAKRHGGVFVPRDNRDSQASPDQGRSTHLTAAPQGLTTSFSTDLSTGSNDDGQSPIDVSLRAVQDPDLGIFFDQQAEPSVNALLNSQTRNHDQYGSHWKSLLTDESTISRTVLANGETAGYLVTWRHSGVRFIAYWFGQDFARKGIASEAMSLFLSELDSLPLFARVAKRNLGSLNVLKKCGFKIRLEGSFVNMFGEPCDEFILSLESNSR